MSDYSISAVLFREGDWWVAQCLEYDIATQAKSLKDLRYELERVLVGHLTVADELGTEPFENLPSAPQMFWEMFDEGFSVRADTPPFRIPKSQHAPKPRLRISDLKAA